MVTFEISGTSDRFWNKNQFVNFLSEHQNQDILLTVVPEAVCLKNLGVYDLLDCFNFASVTIKTWNPFERHERYIVCNHGHSYCLDKKIQIDPTLHDWDHSKTFLCFYHRPTAARLAMASYVMPLSSIVHFSAEIDPDSREQFEFDKLLQWHPPSVTRAATLIDKLPLLQGSKQRLTAFHGYDFDDPLTNLYRSILVDLVVENHVSGNTFFPTEKLVRPMVLKKPFVVFGSVNYLDYLHQMGFLTFNEFWSENYDGYEHGDRLIRIYQVIDKLASMNTQELIKMYWDMKFILDHNFDLIIRKHFNKKIKHI